MSNASVPSQLVMSLGSPLPQVSLVDKPRIRHVSPCNRLTNNQFLQRNASGRNLLDCSSVEHVSCSMDKELLEGVVLGVDLVVELDHVEVDHTAHLLIDRDVSSVFVVFVLEVGSLRSVSENMVRSNGSESFGEFYQPFFASACVHGFVVLPIDVSSVKIVSFDELSKGCSALDRVFTQTGGKFSATKGTHHDLNSSIVVFLFQSFLNRVSVISESVSGPKIFVGF